MTLRLTDAGIRKAFDRLKTAGRTISDSELTDLLAAAADSSSRTTAKSKARLADPTLSAADKAKLVKTGLTTKERADLTSILDQGGLDLSPTARALLEAVVGRDGFTPTTPTTPTNPTGPTTPVTPPAALDDWFGAGNAPADGGLKGKLEALAAQARTTPGLQLDITALLGALGEVADTAQLDGATAATTLATSSRSSQVALLRRGMSGDEANDVRQLLASKAPLTPTARIFLRDLVGERRSIADTLLVAEGSHTTLSSGDSVAFLPGGAISLNGSPPLPVDANGAFVHKEQYVTTTGTITAEGKLTLSDPLGDRVGFVPGATFARDPAIEAAIAARVGRSVGGMLNGQPAVLELVSPEVVRFITAGRTMTARLEPDGSFVFGSLRPSKRSYGEPLMGRFDANGSIQFGTNGRPPKLTTLTLSSAAPPTLDPEATTLLSVLRSRVGSSVTIAQGLSVRLANGGHAEVTSGSQSWPVRIGLDGSFGLSIRGSTTLEVTGTFNVDGTVTITRAWAGSNSLQGTKTFSLQGPVTAPQPFSPTERLLASLTSATVFDEVNVGSGLSVRVLGPNALDILDSNTARTVTVDSNGFFSYQKSRYELVTGLVTPRGDVVFSSGSRVKLPSQRIGPFAPAWREENLVAAYNDPVNFVPMEPGRLAANADAAVLDALRNLTEPLVHAGLLPRNPWVPTYSSTLTSAERAAADNALNQLNARRSTLPPAQAALVDTAMRKRNDLSNGIRGLGGGAMPSTALTWLEQNTSYVRGLPIALTDTIGQAKLKDLLATGLGATAQGSTQTTTFDVQLLSASQVRVSIRQPWGAQTVTANVGPDGAFGYTTSSGAVISGHLTTKRGVVVRVASPTGGPVDSVRMTLNGGGSTAVPQPPPLTPAPIPVPTRDVRAAFDALLTAKAVVATSPPSTVALVRRDQLAVESDHGSFTLSIDAAGRVTGALPAWTEWVPDPMNGPNVRKAVQRPARPVSGTLAADGTLSLSDGTTTTTSKLTLPL